MDIYLVFGFIAEESARRKELGNERVFYCKVCGRGGGLFKCNSGYFQFDKKELNEKIFLLIHFIDDKLGLSLQGSRLTMSQTQETKWIRPDVSSELASVMPETNIQADTRGFSTQGIPIELLEVQF